MSVSKEELDELAISEEEYSLILQKLGREPNRLELGLFGSLWSEHCGYKHSRLLLGMFPTTYRRVLVEIGEENAGAVDIGGGLSIVMKMESHNHPSAIEPYEGAATGVGGIVRDIFTMGARPIALMNSLRFGPLGKARNRHLFNGVVGGIAGYGNCLGIPNVGGEIFFSPTYSENPLVNAFCLGIAETKKLVRSQAGDAGNLLMLVGADTGRDGIHGASGLASRTFEATKELRSAVQVGNPFLEKLLMEACLQLAETDWIVGMQDLGAAGLTSAAVESAYRAGSGLDIDVARVPRREEGMTPYEVMLSESQERMLVVVKDGCQGQVKNLLEHWGLRCDIIGRVTADGVARVREGESVIAQVPVDILNEAPLYRLRARKPEWLSRLQARNPGSVPDISPGKCGPFLLRLLASPNIASKEWVFRQYDHQVGTNTVVPPGNDGAVLRIKGTQKALVLASDGNGRQCYLDPYQGGAMVVAEAARNVVCMGARPLAITDCLNFGSPEREDIYYQLKESIRGLARACRVLGVPVISGNVSLYNETLGQAIYPTPVVGMVGLVEDIDRVCTMGFRSGGDIVLLLGGSPGPGSVDGLAGSEYMEMAHGLVVGRPDIDLGLEKRLQRLCLRAIRRGLIRSAHDCSDGGLAVTLAESSIAGGIGFRGEEGVVGERIDSSLFGEKPSRIVVSVVPGDVARLGEMAVKAKVSMRWLGAVGGDRFFVPGCVDLALEELDRAWRGGLQRELGQAK